MRVRTYQEYSAGDRLVDRRGRKGTVQAVGPVDYLTVLFDGSQQPEQVTTAFTTPLNAWDQPEAQQRAQNPRVQEQRYIEQFASSLIFADFLRFDGGEQDAG